ncbi:hypothetical protein [Priestia megaterium]|uniref:hypothetical protein n=1 Tax=Priestia megaterium TaxID=1404 RepID=UPI002877CFCA|nr:hypothetical protein [Priestia megaterium]
MKIHIVNNSNSNNDNESFESYLNSQIEQGYLDKKDLSPLKCHHCDSENLEDKNFSYENLGLISYERWCNDCGKRVNTWDYGCWGV